MTIVRENIDLVSLLLKHNADSNIKDDVRNGTPLDWAKKFHKQKAIELLE